MSLSSDHAPPGSQVKGHGSGGSGVRAPPTHQSPSTWAHPLTSREASDYFFPLFFTFLFFYFRHKWDKTSHINVRGDRLKTLSFYTKPPLRFNCPHLAHLSSICSLIYVVLDALLSLQGKEITIGLIRGSSMGYIIRRIYQS